MDWQRVDGLIDRSPGIAALRSHRLHLLAASSWRARGIPLPPGLAAAERAAAVATMVSPLVLQQAREAYDGRIALFKGLAVARHYPAPTSRPFGDLDLLVDDAPRAQAALLAAGFEEIGEPELYRDIHHLRPLQAPGLPVPIELHHTVKWVGGAGASPPTHELLAGGVDGVTGIDGILVLAPADHVVCLAAHAWAHEPMLRAGDLLDVLLVAGSADRALILRRAQKWNIDGIVGATLRVADALYGCARTPLLLRALTRHLPELRERTVFESHVTRVAAPLFEHQGAAGIGEAVRALLAAVRPSDGEPWREKVGRVAEALARAGAPRREHEELLGDRAHVGDPVWKRVRERDAR